MDNKSKKRSINTIIYLLLATMLASIVGVSVFTVSLRRREQANLPPAEGSVTKTTSNVTSKPTETTTETTAQTTSAAQTSAGETTAKPAETKELPASASARWFVLPVEGSVAKEYEIDVPVYSLTMSDYRAHTGVDLSADMGSEVLSASGGVICRIWTDPLMGKSLTIDHGEEIYSTYKNLADELADGIEVGVGVGVGQVIGYVGESALIEIAEEPHVHFEMQANGKYVDPLTFISSADQ